MTDDPRFLIDEGDYWAEMAEAEKAADDCRTCNGERMIDASDSTPNEYLIPCPTCCPGEQRITGPTR